MVLLYSISIICVDNLSISFCLCLQGKSLSLICGALKWLRDFQAKQKEEVESVLREEPNGFVLLFLKVTWHSRSGIINVASLDSSCRLCFVLYLYSIGNCP